MTKSEATLAVLVKAREMLTREGAWTKGRLARDADGAPCLADSPKATCWCSIGAIQAASYSLENSLGFAYGDALRELEGAAENLCIPMWNDHPRRGVRSVLRTFDKAINVVRAKVDEEKKNDER